MHHLEVRDALRDAARGLVDREHLLELVALATVAREHLLVIGPPGTAKSEAVRRIGRAFEARTFEYLVGRFTEPNELFGPIDLQRLREGVVETRTEGMLPEAEFAFLDEVFLGSTAILNTLLGLLNDRVFRRGLNVVRSPLRACVGASNALPDDPALAAFSDRFLLRVFVESIPDPQLEALLEAGWAGAVEQPRRASLAALDALSAKAAAMDPSGVREALAVGLRTLRNHGIGLSDRRIVKSQRLVTAAAALAGRDAPTDADLWPVLYAVPTDEGQQTARTLLRSWLERSENPTLPAAAEDASLGPLARATRLVAAGRALLAEAEDRGEPWRLRLEGVAREIDAGFAPDALPAELGEVRAAIVAALA
jgi:MoxR-like ATPase